jgi:hypothetical protein
MKRYARAAPLFCKRKSLEAISHLINGRGGVAADFGLGKASTRKHIHS